MSVSNLTNTKWVFNSSVNITNSTVISFSITFKDGDGATYSLLKYALGLEGLPSMMGGIKYDTSGVYSDAWTDEAYRIIEITGGGDVTNVDLISWLMSNATQVPVTSLANTQWVFNSDIPIEQLNAIGGTPVYEGNKDVFSINFVSVNTNYENIGVGSSNGNNWNGLCYKHIDYSSFDTVYMGAWADEVYRTIDISSGTDIANPDLIVWLSQNATYQEPVPVKTFDLSTLQLSAGTHTIRVKARATGYRDSNFSNSVSYTVTPPQWSCVVAGLGSENPSSVTFTHTGTMPTFEEVTVNSNVFIKIPKMYRKVLATSDNQITSFEIANYKKDNSFVPYPCFVKEDGTTEMDYVLIGKYFTNSNNVMNSVDTNTVTQSINNGRTNARALGSGYQLYDWQMHKLWQDLIICKKQTINTNSGSGIGTNNYDDFGIYWGTSASWIDGVMGIYDSGYWMFSYKPSEYESDSIPNTYIQASYSQPTTGYTEIKKLGYDSSNPFFNYPSDIVFNSNYDTYYCDYYFKGSSKTVFCYVGHLSAAAGAFYCYITSGSVNNQGARLCYRPI